LKPVREDYSMIIVGTRPQNTVRTETGAACRRIEQRLQPLGCDRDFLKMMRRERLCEWRNGETTVLCSVADLKLEKET
jgi:hypothetical protein